MVTDEEIKTIESLIEAYLSSRQDELAEATRRGYRVQFDRFLEWCDEQDVRE
jgi:hypothetical protein